MNSLYDFRIIQISGSDAQDFLQRLSTLDLKKPWLHRPGFFLSPTGKCLAYFDVWRGAGGGDFWFEISAAMTDAFLAFVEKFKFAERFSVKALPWKSTWELRAETEQTEAELIQSEDSLSLARSGFPWRIIWTAKGAQQALGGLDSEAIDAWRVEHSYPWPGAEITSDTNPLETGPRIAVDDQKGCFPGQEVIEKIISLGAPPRKLVKVACDRPTQAGAPVHDSEGAKVGVVTTGGHSQVLALVRKGATAVSP